jgi:hypothetical protein
MGKISSYARIVAAKLADVFVCDQTDNGTTATKSATVEQIGTAIGTLQNFASLNTTSKTLTGAVNEIDGKTGADIPIGTSADTSTIAGAVGANTTAITNATTSTSGTISAGTGCVVRLGSLSKRNGIVTGYFAINMTTPISSRTTIGTIPEGFRPKSNLSYIAPSSSAINFYQDRITNVIITTGGDIIAGDIFVPSGQTIKEVCLTFAYETA